MFLMEWSCWMLVLTQQQDAGWACVCVRACVAMLAWRA